jgi:hypothetical protein
MSRVARCVGEAGADLCGTTTIKVHRNRTKSAPASWVMQMLYLPNGSVKSTMKEHTKQKGEEP